MLDYAYKRILLFIPTMFGVTIITFCIMHLAPGDPVDLFMGGTGGGEGIDADETGDLEKTREDLRKQLGLDRPLYMQYLTWLSNTILRFETVTAFDRSAMITDRVLGQLSDQERLLLDPLEGEDRKAVFLEFVSNMSPSDIGNLTDSAFWRLKGIRLEGNYRPQTSGLVLFESESFRAITLNFGRSFKDQQAVIDRIVERVGITLEINLIALVIAYIIGIPLGIYQSVKQNTAADRSLTVFTFALWSMPTFWVGMLMILFFCNRDFFYWFPASGTQSLNINSTWSTFDLLLDHAYHMILPVLASTYASFAGISRYMRTSMLENMRMDYVRTARAKGLQEVVVILRHVLRNSLIPIVTLFAYLLPGLIAGSIFIETIFTIPGMGFLAFESVLIRDYPMVMALFFIGSVLSLISILIADLLLKVVDPRIEFSKAPS
jgi:peptide/nickel transport system permease protein